MQMSELRAVPGEEETANRVVEEIVVAVVGPGDQQCACGHFVGAHKHEDPRVRSCCALVIVEEKDDEGGASTHEQVCSCSTFTTIELAKLQMMGVLVKQIGQLNANLADWKMAWAQTQGFMKQRNGIVVPQ
jgi:hypothetical protein